VNLLSGYAGLPSLSLLSLLGHSTELLHCQSGHLITVPGPTDALLWSRQVRRVVALNKKGPPFPPGTPAVVSVSSAPLQPPVDVERRRQRHTKNPFRDTHLKANVKPTSPPGKAECVCVCVCVCVCLLWGLSTKSTRSTVAVVIWTGQLLAFYYLFSELLWNNICCSILTLCLVGFPKLPKHHGLSGKHSTA